MAKGNFEMILRSIAICIFMAGVALAQTTAQPTPGRGFRGGPGGRGGGLFGPNSETRLTRQLNLDATQQNTLHMALANARVQQQGTREKETSFRGTLGTAVKSGNESAMNSAATDLENLHQQQTAIHAKTLSTIYNSLNPAQKAKFEPLMNRELGIPGLRFGPGRGTGRGPGPARGLQPAQP
jgi:Spy/CpxP family protein refolding chaperone